MKHARMQYNTDICTGHAQKSTRTQHASTLHSWIIDCLPVTCLLLLYGPAKRMNCVYTFVHAATQPTGYDQILESHGA